MKRFFTFVFFISLASDLMGQSPVRSGSWRGVLLRNDSVEIPFSFTLEQKKNNWQLTVINAEEKIVAEDLIVTNDSVNWHMPVFDSYFKCRRENDSVFSGLWFNNAASKPYTLRFEAKAGHIYRITDQTAHAWGLGGNYKAIFNPGAEDEYNALGVFKKRIEKGHMIVTGTFATETGDYRYLDGQALDYNTTISCFDGSHAFLFRFHGINDTIRGEFYSGKSGFEKFIMLQNDTFRLRDPNKLTLVKDSVPAAFTFTALNGKPVSLADDRFKNKVVVIQIMGSWCPNCMDETKWLSGVYKKLHPKGLEIIALAYERTSDTAKANTNLRRLKTKYAADYVFLNTGKSGKGQASESLPFISGVMAFPTTIYIDKKGKVRRVYTGFNGPATGVHYERDTGEAIRFIQELLAE